MAPHARMLFLRPPNATACLTECSDACKLYDLCGPFLYASPPPPPPPPPQQNPTSPIRLHHSSRLSLALVASASSLAAASLILLLSCLLSLHLRRRRRSASSAAVGGGGGAADAGGFVDEDGEVDHHVWYIRTVGLDEPTIGAIAVWVYQSGEGGVLVGGGGGGGGGGEEGCAVCLAEFRDGELLRLLPKCGHAFHVACIDAWLRGHVNCPLCRAPIMAPSPAPAPAPAPADALPSLSPSLSPSSSSSSSSSGSTISDHDGSDSSNQAEARGIEEETDAGDVEIGGDNAIEVNSTVELSSSSSRVLSNSQSQDKV